MKLKPIYKVLLFQIVLSCIAVSLPAQHDWNWTFGDFIVMRFPSGGAPVVDSGTKSVYFEEAGACYSDKNGDLLLYSNHDSIYNMLIGHQVQLFGSTYPG